MVPQSDPEPEAELQPNPTPEPDRSEVETAPEPEPETEPGSTEQQLRKELDLFREELGGFTFALSRPFYTLPEKKEAGEDEQAKEGGDAKPDQPVAVGEPAKEDA